MPFLRWLSLKLYLLILIIIDFKIDKGLRFLSCNEANKSKNTPKKDITKGADKKNKRKVVKDSI